MARCRLTGSNSKVVNTVVKGGQEAKADRVGTLIVVAKAAKADAVQRGGRAAKVVPGDMVEESHSQANLRQIALNLLPMRKPSR